MSMSKTMRLLKVMLLAGAIAAPAGSALAFGPFSVGPHYKPRDPAPAVLLGAAPEAVSTAAEPGAAWWGVYEDPVLGDLLNRAVAGNLDLKIAAARLKEARALFRDRQLDYAPRITSDGTYNRSEEQIPGFGPARVPIESAQLGFDAAWEIDLFGRVSHGVDAARADAGAVDADARNARISVMAEVARNYFELRGAQARLTVARQNLDSQRETVRLTKVRFDIGRGAGRAAPRAGSARGPPGWSGRGWSPRWR